MTTRPGRGCPSMFNKDAIAARAAAAPPPATSRGTKKASASSKGKQRALDTPPETAPSSQPNLEQPPATQNEDYARGLRQHLASQQTSSNAGLRGLTPGVPPPPPHGPAPSSSSAPVAQSTSTPAPAQRDIPVDPLAGLIDPDLEVSQTSGQPNSGEAVDSRAAGPVPKQTRAKAKDGKGFIKITKVYGGEGVVFLGHPNIVKQRRRLQLNGKKDYSSNSNELEYHRWASTSFRGQQRQVSTSDLNFGETSIAFKMSDSAPPTTSFRSILNTMEDMYEVALKELQSDGGARIREIHKKYEDAVEAARIASESTRAALQKYTKMSEEEIEAEMEKITADVQKDLLAKRRAEEGLPAEDEEEDEQVSERSDSERSDSD
ncbi:hypothetical protein JCM5350_007047 [Sporobolomyces pararoseus]